MARGRSWRSSGEVPAVRGKRDSGRGFPLRVGRHIGYVSLVGDHPLDLRRGRLVAKIRVVPRHPGVHVPVPHARGSAPARWRVCQQDRVGTHPCRLLPQLFQNPAVEPGGVVPPEKARIQFREKHKTVGPGGFDPERDLVGRQGCPRWGKSGRRADQAAAGKRDESAHHSETPGSRWKRTHAAPPIPLRLEPTS